MLLQVRLAVIVTPVPVTTILIAHKVLNMGISSYSNNAHAAAAAALVTSIETGMPKMEKKKLNMLSLLSTVREHRRAPYRP